MSKRFGATLAVNNLDLAFAVGKTMALLAPSGAGKSTTIAMLLGLLSPDAREIRVLGQQPREVIAAGRVGAMLMSGVTVRELLTLTRARFAAPLPFDEIVQPAALQELPKCRAGRLSGGQAQRVRFALAITGDPLLLVLDEPTVALDVESRRAFWQRMGALAAAGKTIIFATHCLDEPEQAADRVVIIAHGRIIADGSVAATKTNLGERRLRFTLRGDCGALEALRLPGRTERNGRQVTRHTTDTDAAVRALVASRVARSNLAVEAADVEDAFLTLTGEAQ